MLKELAVVFTLMVSFVLGAATILTDKRIVTVKESLGQPQVYYKGQNYRLVPCAETQCK